MFGSKTPHNPPTLRDRKDDDPPGPDDRYAPRDCVRLEFFDFHGNPVVAILSRRAAQTLADQLFQRLATAPPKGGVS